MKTNQFPACLLAFAITMAPMPGTSALAESRLLPFQGRLTDANGNSIPDGARVVQFKIYDAPVGGKAVWVGEVQNLTVNAGLVSTILGSRAALSGVDFNLDLYLEVTIDANGDGQISLADPPLLPRQSILPAVFSRESGDSRLLDGYDWSALFGTNNPAEGTLLDSKIADASLTSAKIQDGAVTTAKIPNGAITRPKLDTTGATAGQSLLFNGTQAIWGPVNAVNASFATNAGNATTAGNANTAINSSQLGGFTWFNLFNNGNPSTGLLNVGSALIRGDFFLGNGGGDYRKMSLGGGNSTGYFYGSFPRFGDGIHLGYNYYADGGGGDHIVGADGGTSRLSLGYGSATIATAAAFGGPPVTSRFRVTTSQVIVENASFFNGSDRNTKQDFAPVDSAEILEKVTQLPISEWSYKADPSSRHIGPMAQDFHAAFQLGFDDKHIAPIDEGGVALAAIQALNTKVEQTDDDIRELLRKQQEHIEALRAELAALKQGRQ